MLLFVQGASQIYRRVINPYLEQYEGEIDNGLEGMRVEARRRIQSLGATAASEIARAVTRQGTSAVSLDSLEPDCLRRNGSSYPALGHRNILVGWRGMVVRGCVVG